MKRQIMKGLMAFCAGVMTLCAASSLTVSCDMYDDTLLKEEIAGLKGELADMDGRVKAIEELKAKLEEVTKRVDALYTLSFQVSDKNELQYSFDGGKTWNGTKIILAEECDKPCTCEPVEPCKCPKVDLVDNGNSVTISVGDKSFTIEKPEEIAFEIRAGKVYFASEATQVVIIKSSGIEDVTVMAAPKGWEAEINADGYLEVTAPSTEDLTITDWWGDVVQEGTADASGYIKIHACSSDGKCMVGKLAVEVSETQIVVKAYGGNYEVVSTDEYSAVFYGVSLKENYKADVQKLIDGWANNQEFAYEWKYKAEPAASGKLSEVLGYEPKVGEEYVVWAMYGYDGWDLPKIDDLVLAFYSPISVNAVEDQTKRTAYDNYITLTVQGVDSYYALAVPDLGEFGTADQYKQMMVDELIYTGQAMGKFMKENYTGSFYQITSGTQSYVGEGAPGTTGTLLVLPLDGRPNDQYTVEDVKEFKFSTNKLTSGGAVKATAEQTFKKTTGQGEVELNAYSELGVKVTAPEAGWKYFYFAWMTEDEYKAALNGDSDMIVDFVLKSPASYPIAPDELDPVIVRTSLDPAQSMHFVCFIVDEAGKYGEVTKLKLTTDKLEKSDITVTGVTNLVDDAVLKNNHILEVTLTPSQEALKYKYVWTETTWYNQYEGKNEEAMADAIFFAEVNNYGGAQEVLVSDLPGGKLSIPEHSYNTPYYLAILPYDKDGKPGKAALIYEYNCTFELAEVITKKSEFVSEPTAVYNVPASMDQEEAYSYYINITDWGSSVSYNGSYTVTAAETGEAEILTLMVESSDVEGMTELERASGLWARTLNSYYTKEGAGTFDKSFYGNASGPITPVILVSWRVGDKYYYKEVNLADQFNKMFINIIKSTDVEVENTPDGKQWAYMDTAISETEGFPMVLDFGVAFSGQMAIAFDYTAMAGMPYLNVLQAPAYDIKPLSETNGFIVITTMDHFGDAIETLIPYYGLTAETCTFGNNSLLMQEAVCTLTTIDPSAFQRM